MQRGNRTSEARENNGKQKKDRQAARVALSDKDIM